MFYIQFSVLGHYVPELPGFNLNIYPGTKYCMTASTEVLRKEMIKMGNKSKVTVSIFNSNTTEVRHMDFFRMTNIGA